MQVWHAIGPDGLPEQLPLDSLDQNLPPPIGEVLLQCCQMCPAEILRVFISD
jgi:hypothetical protein